MLLKWELVLGWILTVVIVIGNGIVIFLITTRRNLRTTTNWFVLSLAVADFGFGTFYFPRLSVCEVPDQTCVNNTIYIAFSIGVCFVFASVTNLCALTLDRYLAIVKPLRYVTFMTKKRVALLIFAAWSVALPVLILFLILLLATSGTTYQVMAKGVTAYITLLCIFVFIFLLVATARIFLIGRKHSRQTAALTTQLNYNYKTERGRFGNHNTGATRMIGTLVAVFVLSYSLDIYVNVCLFADLCPLHDITKAFNTLTLLMNSAVNPVAYAFFKREIRRELKKLFRSKGQQSQAPHAFNIKQEQRKTLPVDAALRLRAVECTLTRD